MNQGLAQLQRFETAEALATSAAKGWLEALSAAPAGKPLHVALSGGRIAGRFFERIVELARERPGSLSRVEFFWADERCVPPTDPESNFKLAQAQLLAPLGIDPIRVHRIRGELDKETAAADAEQAVRRIVPLAANGQPLLDLVLLGMGEDGHVASLFPRDLPEAELPGSIYRGVVGPKPPPERVTLSYAALSGAREVWVLASGAGKEDALRRSLELDGTTPLGRLLKLRRHTKILTEIKA